MIEKLHTEPRIEDPDDFYARLIAMHDGLSPDASNDLNCKLILLMANHIGEKGVLLEVLDAVCNDRPQKAKKAN